MRLQNYYAALHGVIITLVYSGIKYLDVDGSLHNFCKALVLGLLILLPFCVKSLGDLFKPILMIKGISFGLTQIFIYKTLIESQVSNTMIASIFGGIVVTFGGVVFLREKLTSKAYIGVAAAFLGSIFYFYSKSEIILISSYAFIAGFLQGTTTTITRSNVKRNICPKSIIFSNFIWGSVAMLGYIVLTTPKAFSDLSLPFQVWFLAFAIIVAQISLFLMMKLSTTQVSASLSLTRIPTSLCVDSLIFSSPLFLSDFLSTTFILGGLIYMTIKQKQTNTDSKVPKKETSPQIA